MVAISETSSGMILPMYLTMSTMNGMGRPDQVVSDNIYAWTYSIPSPVIAGLYSALPDPFADVFRERMFTVALQNRNLDKITAILRLGMNTLECMLIPTSPARSVLMSPIDFALTYDHPQYEIAELLVTHICRTGTLQQMNAALGRIVKFVLRSSFCDSSGGMRLMFMLLSAGATPVKECLTIIDQQHDPSLAKKLVETREKSIHAWLQVGLLVYHRADARSIFRETSKRNTRRLCDGEVLRYVLCDLQHELSTNDPVTRAALVDALYSAFKESQREAVEIILFAFNKLGYQMNPEVQTEAEIQTSINTFASKGPCALLCKTPSKEIVQSRPTCSRGCLQGQFDRAINDDNIPSALRIHRALGDSFRPRWETISMASDGLIIALFNQARTHRLWVSIDPRAMLMDSRIALVSRVLKIRPSFEVALRAASEYEDFSLLNKLVETGLERLFPQSNMFVDPILRVGYEYPFTLRALAYHAMEVNDFDLFLWLLESGLDCEEAIFDKTGAFQKRPVMSGFIKTRVAAHGEGLLLSLLAVAAAYNKLNWIEFLVKHGVDGRDSMALWFAVESKSDDETICMLLKLAQSKQRGSTGTYGSAALRTAVRRGDKHMIDLLWDMVDVNGIEASTPEVMLGKSCLSPLGEAIIMEDLGVVNIMIQKGVDLNALVAHDGQLIQHDSELRYTTPMLAAIDLKNHEIVKSLIAGGIDLRYKPRLGIFRTPLQRAAEIGSFEIVNHLIEKGAEVDTVPTPGGGTALQLAAMKGYVGIATLLLEHGANPNYPPPDDGRTAFELAAEWSRIDMMLLLMRWGVQLDLEFGNPLESQYERAQEFAAENGQPAAKRFVQHLYTLTPERLRTEDAQALGLLASPPPNMTSPW
jgi:hypothetical protein